ncbi:MAG: hypothetical protein IPP37_12945 [Saprospiraceae bacterium]|nr:hypothetical protein [Saprospiraceae bacterium]
MPNDEIYEFDVYYKGSDAINRAFSDLIHHANREKSVKMACDVLSQCLSKFSICITHIYAIKVSEETNSYLKSYLSQIFNEYILQFKKNMLTGIDEATKIDPSLKLELMYLKLVEIKYGRTEMLIKKLCQLK